MSNWTADPGEGPPTVDSPPRPSDGSGQPADPWAPNWAAAPPTGPTPAPPFGESTRPFDPPPPPPLPPLGAAGRPAPPRRTKGTRGLLAALVVLLAVLAAGVGYGVGRLSSGNGGAASPATTVAERASDVTTVTPLTTGETTGESGSRTNPNQTAPALDPRLEDAAAVNKAVGPAVVQIETGSGLGSGFIYAKEGYILTAAHVVGPQRQVTVRLADGVGVPGEVVGADANNDVAVVKIDPPEDLPTVALALDETPLVGTTAIAIGSPFGLDQTVTKGIVSAVGRPVPSGNGNIVAMIQTDASINSGNSGGPLVNREGKVIGVNVQIRTTTGANSGIGFAVPIDIAYDVAQALIEGRPIELGFLGVSSGNPGVGRSGALVAMVEPASPAAQAGILVGDLITAIDGRSIKDFAELAAAVRARTPGDRMDLTVERDGQTTIIEVIVGRR